VVCGFSGGLYVLLGISLNDTFLVARIETWTRLTLIGFAVILMVYLWNTTYSSPAAKAAIIRIIGGRDIAVFFWIGVMALGVVIPIGISIGINFIDQASSALLLTAVVTEVIGGLSLRYVILKGGS
jgi:formate-dependent nitrite reductase membrane component NrfD